MNICSLYLHRNDGYLSVYIGFLKNNKCLTLFIYLMLKELYKAIIDDRYMIR